MAISTATLTVNAAFFHEIKVDNRRLQDLIATLRDVAVAADEPRSDRRRIAKLLKELRDQLAFHFALEEAYGYFDQAVDVAPHAAALADELRKEHEVLYQSICELAEYAEYWILRQVLHDAALRGDSARERSSEPSFQRILARYQQFDDQLQEHESKENALILEAFDTDIGGEG
jgi:hypothetical protein